MNREYEGFQEQNGSFLLETAVGVMNNAFAGGKADFIKILPAVPAHIIAVHLNLEHIESL